MDQCYAQGGWIEERTPPLHCRCNGGASPILVDTRGNGIRLSSDRDGVLFDMRGAGVPQRLAWTLANSDEAFLALDRNGNGLIDNGTELFGNLTSQPPSPNPNGFLALAGYDKPENGGNADAVIDHKDAIFSSLRLWVDANHDGVSQPAELFTLPALGIHSISLNYQESRRRDRFGNSFRYRAKVNPGIQGDEAGPWAFDVFFVIQLAGAQITPASTPTADSPGTIDGSTNPEKIPTDAAYRVFLRIASCPDNADSLRKKKCGLVRGAVGLSAEDNKELEAELTTFISEVLPLDETIAGLRHSTDVGNQSLRAAAITQRHELIKAKVAALHQKLSPQGGQQLDSYIEAMKAKMKFVPAPTTAQ